MGKAFKHDRILPFEESSKRQAELFYSDLMGYSRRRVVDASFTPADQVLSPGANILVSTTPRRARGLPVLGRSANGALLVPAESVANGAIQGVRRARSVVEALQSLRQQMDMLDDLVRTRPASEARRILNWGQRRLELALDDLLERRPVREPGLLEQLIAITAPRLSYARTSTKPAGFENYLSESLPSPQRVLLPIPTSSSRVSTFWGSVRATNAREQAGGKMAVYVEGDLLYLAFPPSIMRVIQRTRTELFSTTVTREVAAHNLRTAINGNVFDVSFSGKIDIGIGHDPVPASDTSSIGQVVSGGRVVTGSSQPNRFYLAYNASWAAPLPPQHSNPAFHFGMGNPPVSSGGADTALGGLGPIIIGGLRYGVGNLYRASVPTGAPRTGPVSSTYRPFLIQRNNNTYASLQSRGAAVGKVIVAINRSEDMLLVLVQRDGGTSGMTLDTLRNKLVAIGCDDAVFGDGSDSVMLVVGGTRMIAQGSDKEEATTIGLGFT